MAQQTEAVREQQAVVRGETDNTFTRIEAVESTVTKSFELFSKSARFQSSQQERLH